MSPGELLQLDAAVHKLQAINPDLINMAELVTAPVFCC
jgi:hypothetical protein